MIDPDYDDLLFEADLYERIYDTEFDEFRKEDEHPFGLPHDVFLELIGKDNE